MRLNYLARALRLPFITASALPFIFGSLIVKGHFNTLAFFLGLSIVIATHLGANLINDYADSKSGVDSADKKFYGFFGGSKLIQEGVFPDHFYLKSAIACFAIAIVCGLSLAFILKSLLLIFLYFGIAALSFVYSHKPFQFAYHKLGELIILILFGPCLVMGGYFIQARIFPDLRSFLLSLPLGLLTTAILFANEIPDYLQDQSCGKRNWVEFLGPAKSYLLYLFIVISAFIFIAVNINMGYLNKFAFISFLFLLPAFRAAGILKSSYSDKAKLVVSSKLTIIVHTWVCVALILSVVIG